MNLIVCNNKKIVNQFWAKYEKMDFVATGVVTGFIFLYHSNNTRCRDLLRIILRLHNVKTTNQKHT